MKKKPVLLVSALTALCLALNALISCLGEAVDAGKATRTVMLYFCGSDLEESYALATWNLYQVMQAEIPDDVNVVVMTGGALKWKTEPEYLEGAEVISPNRENQAWRCSGKNGANATDGHGRMTLLTDLPTDIENTLMSDPQTLTGFINYAAAKYPAEIYDLVLWDHGGGPAYGFGLDYRAGGQKNIMSVAEITKALKESDVERFDIIDFDACLMGSVEIAAALSECADYLILSPETEPGFGQEYVTVMNAIAKDSRINGFELGRIFVDALVAFYEDETTYGYGMDGTLAVIDAKNFRERLAAPVTRLAGIMDAELTKVGSRNRLLNLEDELRSQSASYAYTDDTLLDLGNFAEHLGMCITEIDNTSAFDDFERLANNYTETTEAITAILADRDGSGDDVIYVGATAGMTKPARTKVAFARDGEGIPQRVETVAPSGLSIFFAPTNMNTMDYAGAIDALCEAVSDEDTRAMLRAVEVAALRYLLAAKCGATVAELKAAGEQNVYYNTVWSSWQLLKPLDWSAIERYKQQFGLSAAIQEMEAADWDTWIGPVVEILNRYSTVDTETWLALLAAQQSSQALNADKTTAVGVDRTGDGVEDVYRVTIASPLKQVRDASISLDMGLDIDDPGELEMLAFLGIGDSVSLGRVRGTPVQDAIVGALAMGGTLGDGVRELFESESCAYDLPTAVDRWYELLDGDGIGHVIAVGDVDLTDDQELYIPVEVKFAEPDEDGSDREEIGYFIYGNGRFKGFMNINGYSPMISLNSSAFNGATVTTIAAVPFDFLGLNLHYPLPLGESFTLPMESSADRGMKLVMTPIEQINDLAGKALATTATVTDLYGCAHDISAAVQDAREAAALGSLTYSIDAAEITVPDAVFNRRQQLPEVTVTLNGETLTLDEDYILVAEKMLKAGTEEITLLGAGDYVGYAKASFTIVPGESTVRASEAVAAGDLAEGDVTVLTVDTPAHPDNVQFDFSATDPALRDSLAPGSDGKSVVLKKGATPGTYSIAVNVIDGGEDTYANIDGETWVIEVK